MRHVLCIFKSTTCKVVFLLTLLAIYLLMPREFFVGATLPIALLFLLLTAVVLTCIVRTIKERVILARNAGAGLLAIIAMAFGLAALQVCGVGAPVCGATIGVALLSLFLPGASMTLLHHSAWIILSASILLQVAALYFMNCFKEERARQVKR